MSENVTIWYDVCVVQIDSAWCVGSLKMSRHQRSRLVPTRRSAGVPPPTINSFFFSNTAAPTGFYAVSLREALRSWGVGVGWTGLEGGGRKGGGGWGGKEGGGTES